MVKMNIFHQLGTEGRVQCNLDYPDTLCWSLLFCNILGNYYLNEYLRYTISQWTYPRTYRIVPIMKCSDNEVYG